MIVIVKVLSLILFITLIYPFILVVASAIFGKSITFGRILKPSKVDFACVITAYKQISIVIPLVDSILKQSYNSYHIYIIADRNEGDFRFKFDSDKITIHYPEKPLDSKVRSMKYAIERFVKSHDYIVIFDPDNLVLEHYLEVLNSYIQLGFRAVQTRRVAKNLDTDYAKLDAIGEIYHNYVSRLVPFRLGSSSTIAGSGMAIEYKLFLGYLNSELIQKKLHGVILGEDKMLHNYLVGKGEVIAFADNILTFDEKVTDRTQVTRQRTRWIKTYFENVESAFSLIVDGFVEKFNFNKVLFGLSSLYPPLFLLIAFSLSMAILSFFIDPISSLILFIGICIFAINFVIVLLLAQTPIKIFKAFIKLPLFIFSQFIGMFNMKIAKSDFLVTEKRNKP